MITTLPRLRDPKGAAAEILPRLASDRRKKIPQVGKVFPKTLITEQVDEKLDFHCVGLEKDKNVSFPTVEMECSPSSHGAEEGASSPLLEPGDGTEITLPELPSILGSRRSNTAPSPDISEPLDLLIKGEARKKSPTQVSLEDIEEPPVVPVEEVMRANLEPFIDNLFEEDELFAQDFEEDGLNRILFIRKMGICVEVKTKDYMSGIFCTPLFHCPRCKDYWTEFGTVPENCQYARQPTRGPAIHLASNMKPRSEARRRKTKRRLGDIKEGCIVSGSGTVLNEIDDNVYEDPLQDSYLTQYQSNRPRPRSTTGNAASRDYLTSDEVKLEDVSLREIDSTTIIEAFKEVADPKKLDKGTYVKTLAATLGVDSPKLADILKEVGDAAKLDKKAYFQTIAATALGIDSTKLTDILKEVGDAAKLDKKAYFQTIAAAALGIDSTKLTDILKEVGDAAKLDKKAYFQTIAAAALGIDSTKLTDILKEVGDAAKLDKKAYFQTIAAAALGIDSTKLTDAFKEVDEAAKLDKGGYLQTIAAALGVDSTTVMEAFEKVDAQKVDEETYVENMAAALGVETTVLKEALGVDSTTIMEAFKKVDALKADKEAYVQNMAAALGIEMTALREAFFDEDRYNDYARVNLSKTGNKSDEKIDKTRQRDLDFKRDESYEDLTATLASATARLSVNSSVRLILNSSVLNSLKVKDLPEQVKLKLLSLLRLQRKRKQKQALSNKNKATEEISGSIPGVKEGGSRVTSASGRRHSVASFMDSDEEGFPTSKSPSDVLAYKEIQSQRRSRKKNPSVKNRSGQPDTPHQRLGRHSMAVPSNSSSFYSYDDGDSDEEYWGRIRPPRVGSSRAHLSDSQTSYMSDMARAPHVTDSRNSMLRKYSRAMGSARARGNVSFSNLDDQMSYDALANDDSMYDFDEATDDPKSTRARRAIRKKEKGDGVKRPGTYHSKVIQDMTLGQGSSSMSHVTASFADSNMMYGSNARLSQARISLTEASSALISGDSTVMNPVKKRSLRPVSSISVKEHAQIRKETPEPEYTREHYDESTLAADCSALAGDCPSLAEDYPALPENTTLPATLPSAQAQEETEPKMLFKRVEKRKPLVLLEDLNFIHRLPVSSAFTYSFYELPNQHRQQNDSIKKAADRIGRRKKKESGHFRSRSAP